MVIPNYVRLAAHATVSGGDISPFGGSYANASPMGQRIAHHGN
ncbi:hypothetical protein B932_2215 [Gluconobacter oxydans H24]|nr:hypothetical protein B932_2215 [Gluconobacter oxydans H24]